MSVRTIVSLMLLSACGPVVEEESASGGSTGTQTGSTSGSTGAGETSGIGTTTVVTHTGSTAAPASSSGGSSTGDDLLLPAGSVYSEGTCQPDGSVNVYVEAWFAGAASDCVPAPEVDEDLLQILLTGWDGFETSFEIVPMGANMAAHGLEPVEGEVSIETWAPFHPTLLHVSLHGPSTSFEGTLDLEQCHQPAPRCESEGTTG